MYTPGACVGGYEIVGSATIGAMSEVYEGRDPDTRQPVAIKLLHEEWCRHQEVTARFLNEAHTLHAIRHPHVVTVIAHGNLPDGRPFVILEWLPWTLEHALVQTGRAFAASIARRAAGQLADALAALHLQGIVHRDLKPANVLLSHQDPATAQIKLADLGLAKVQSQQATSASGKADESLALMPVSTGGDALLGTWDYMAPEQWIRSKDADPKVDVYALGVLLFQMLAGRLPFVAEQPSDLMYLHLFEPPPLHLLAGHADMDPGTSMLRDLITRMMNKAPPERPEMCDIAERLAQRS